MAGHRGSVEWRVPVRRLRLVGRALSLGLPAIFGADAAGFGVADFSFPVGIGVGIEGPKGDEDGVVFGRYLRYLWRCVGIV